MLLALKFFASVVIIAFVITATVIAASVITATVIVASDITATIIVASDIAASVIVASVITATVITATVIVAAAAAYDDDLPLLVVHYSIAVGTFCHDTITYQRTERVRSDHFVREIW